MPLKHSTESVYVAVLAVVIVLTGIAIALLPPLPQSLVYFGILLVLTILYPVVLIPTYRTNRADYEFRLMHWFPFAMVVVWGALQMLGKLFDFAGYILAALLFLWALPLVFLGLLLLVLFCITVVRRRNARIAFLSIIFGVFLIAAALSASMGFNPTLGSAIYRKPLLIAGSGSVNTGTGSSSSSIAMVSSSSSKNLSSKSVSRSSVPRSSKSSERSNSSSSIRSLASQSSSKAPTLPHSGPAEMASVAVMLLGLYSAVVHKRNR